MKFKELLGFCAAVRDGRIRTRDDCGNPLFAELRFDGYVAALTGGFVESVVLFGPEHETSVIRAYMTNRGAPHNRIGVEETHVTTVGNAHVMRQYLARRDLRKLEVVGSTSHYHLPRAQLMGEVLHDFGITWVAAEAFLFAKTDGAAAVDVVRRRLFDEFGTGGLAQRMIAEIKGQGDFIAERYQSQKDKV